jgi:hypothetical protein
MKGLGNCFWFAGDGMLVNFNEIVEIAFIVHELEETLVINNVPVNEITFGLYVSNTYDA